MSERLSLPESVNRLERVKQLVRQRMPEFSEFSPEARENALISARVLFVDNIYRCLGIPILPEKRNSIKTAKEAENLLSQLIGCQNNFGLERDGDNDIWQEVDRRVAESPEPVKILEVGAGSTLPLGFHEGSPWLARAMALHFGEDVKITVTDKFGDQLLSHCGYAYYLVSPDNIVLLENPDPCSISLTRSIELPPETD
ncbi:MAG TPA: hypothetical protein PK263_02730, partial [bacterium]|nr:hypothetical protein [bacterium]